VATNFLKAEWRKLAMVNYAIDPKILTNYIPNQVELDLWNNICYVSLVGFMFLDTKIKGIKIPFHRDFEEVNLRFYVRYNNKGEWKRGVVFIKEIVPKPALTFVANTIYKENYETMPMNHSWEVEGKTLLIQYRWKKERWNSLKVMADNVLINIEPGSEEEFITEHYWGYTKIQKTTSEYQVEHPRWQVYPISSWQVDVDFGLLYGKDFDFLKNEKPKSVFLAEGSDIKVNSGIKI
jgi:uncharacterized protein